MYECTVFDPITNLDTQMICMDVPSVTNIGLYVRAAERYHEAAEVCRGK
jgi:hypothetical protein